MYFWCGCGWPCVYGTRNTPLYSVFIHLSSSSLLFYLLFFTIVPVPCWIGLENMVAWVSNFFAGPFLVWLKFCWQQSNVLPRPCLKKLIALSFPSQRQIIVVHWHHGCHSVFLPVYNLNADIPLSCYTPTLKTFWNSSMSFTLSISYTSICKHMSILQMSV